MHFSRTLFDVREQVQADDTDKWDALAPCRDIFMRHGRLEFPQAQEDGYDNGLYLSPWALSQACQKIRVPAAYFRRCPADLQDMQFNYWIKQQEMWRHLAEQPEEAWLIRSKGTVIRGVLSPRYTKLDNANLLSTLAPILEDSRLRVAMATLSPESFHLRLVDPSLARAVLPGDTLMAGVHLANSEVGRRAVTVDALVFRLVCTNGLIRLVKGKSLLHQRHFFASEEKFQEKLGVALREAVTVSAGFLERIQQATSVAVPDVQQAISALSERWELSDSTQELIRFHLLAETSVQQQETLYGLANAITAAAQRLPVDERYELEVRAGQLIEQGKVPIRSNAADATSSPTAAAHHATGAYPEQQHSHASVTQPAALVAVP